MAHAQDNPASPHSSNGVADSINGTPDTRLTAFSPDDGSSNKPLKEIRSLSRSDLASSAVRLPVDSYQSASSHLDKDPFISPDHSHTSRLSPTASTFSPFTGAAKLSNHRAAGSVATALSSDLGLSRHLNVHWQGPAPVPDMKSLLAELSEHGGFRQEIKHVASDTSNAYLYFADIRDACNAQARISRNGKGWKAEFMNHDQLTETGPEIQECFVNNTGQVHVAVFIPPGAAVAAAHSAQVLQGHLETFGRLFALVKQVTFANGSFQALAEFCDSSAALHAVTKSSSGATVKGIHIIVSGHCLDTLPQASLVDAMRGFSLAKKHPHQPQTGQITANERANLPSDIGVHQPFMYPLVLNPPFQGCMPYVFDSFFGAKQTNAMDPIAPIAPSYPIVSPLYQTPLSPALTPRNSYSPSRSLSGYGRSDPRRQNAMRISRSSFHSVTSHHNHVDICRIREGIDVRTTIMLRNIPNKVDQAMLKRIVDESSWGKYDFMYLRIDFANDCNVGYAFINFVDPLDIIDFVDARGNQRWNCFKSDKIAEISYATIQGKDCLVQKFRNSSVMLEAPHYRPKLYFTSNGPVPDLAGQEEPFPDPDNQSKMKRSCENAEHVGLFTPNAGQHFRDEQRRRRSQYDRGTRLAALEEYDYEAAIQQLYANGAQ